MKSRIFVAFLALMPCAQGTEIFNPLNVLNAGEREVVISQKWQQQEREYEISTRILDERDYSSLATNISAGFGLFRSFSVRLGAEIAYAGELNKTFDSSVGFQNQKIDFWGPRFLWAKFQYYSEVKKLAFELYGKTLSLKAKDTNASLGGTDAGMAFRYLYSHGRLDLFGKLFVEVEGKKRLTRYDGERETTDPYTKFGKEINLRANFGKFWTMIGGHFLLATDLVTRSPSYNRSSDKGFGVGGIIEMGWNEGPWALKAYHLRGGEVFNVISEEASLQREYEIEFQTIAMELAWRW